MAARDRDVWLGDFSLVLSKEHFQLVRRDPQYEVFSGSKLLAFLWLVAAAGAGGALGGTLVSGALWGPWWQVPAWIVALVATAFVVYRLALALFGPPLGFMAGWSLFWGLLIGAIAMWGAQLVGPGWAYGIAGAIGFLVGITQGIYEPDDLRGHDGFSPSRWSERRLAHALPCGSIAMVCWARRAWPPRQRPGCSQHSFSSAQRWPISFPASIIWPV